MTFDGADPGSVAIDYLLRCGIETAILVPLILIVQRLSGHRLSPTVKHALWFILLVRLSLPVFPESQLSLFQVADRIQQDVFAEENIASLHPIQRIVPSNIAQQPRIENPIQAPAPPSKTPSPTTRDLLTSNSSPSFSVEPAHDSTPSPSITRDDAQSVPLRVERPANSTSESWAMPWREGSLAIWIGGMILISIRIVRKSAGLHQHLQRTAPIRSPNLQKRVDKTKAELGLKKEIRIYQTNRVTSPAVFGLFSPSILLPTGFLDSYSDDELDHILKHELAHIKRQDTVWNLWSTLIQMIHWPNPIVWYATGRMRGDRELATDYLALNGTSKINPQAYGETILKTLQMVPNHNPIPGLIGIAEERRGLIRRFDMIANFTTTQSYSKWLSALLAISLSVTCLTDSPLLNTSPEKEPTTPTQSPAHNFHVLVTDTETGNPLEDVSVSYVIGLFSDSKELESGSEKTDSAGSVRFQIAESPRPNSIFMLYATAQNGYISQSRMLDDRIDHGHQLPTRHEFKLRIGAKIGGTVVDEQNQPIENVALQLRGSVQFPKGNHLTDNRDRLYANFEAGITTDKHGRWTCPGVPDSATQFQITLRKENGAEFHYSTTQFMNGRRSYSEGAPIVSTELREKTSRLTFPDGSNINVTIKDETGQPIAGAKVQELSGALSRQKGTTLTTDRSGKVRFRERTVHEIAYIVSHSDYAIAQELAVPTLGVNSIEVVLKPKQLLEGSIVNQEGEAIEAALLDLKTDANEKMFSDWSTQSNRDGEFFWGNAPLAKTFYRIRADGYAPRVVEATPASSPLKIVLDRPSEAIAEHTIQVLDAETNEPIPAFTYSRVTSWSYQHHTEDQGTDGLIFKKASPDQMAGDILGRQSDHYYILARAPGYSSARSRPISLYESESHSIIRLERAPQKHSFKNVVILAPNGETADRAVVTLVTDNFLSRPFAEYTTKTIPPKSSIVGIQIRADRHGRLPDSGLPLGFRGIAIADPQGALTIPASRLDMTGKTLQLQSLGTVTGTYRIKESPMAFHQIYLRATSSKSSLFEYADYTGTDDNGQFIFKNLPSGIYRLFRSDKRLHDSSARQFYPRDIIVRPGETTQVDYHLEGHTVVGRFTSNSPKESINWQEGIYALRKANIAKPQDLPPTRRQYVTYFRMQEALHRFNREKERPTQQQAHTYPVDVTPDGQFSITSVPPGDYVLEADILKSVSHSNSRSTQKRPIGQHSVSIAIPSEYRENPINVGKIKVSAISTSSRKKSPLTQN